MRRAVYLSLMFLCQIDARSCKWIVTKSAPCHCLNKPMLIDLFSVRFHRRMGIFKRYSWKSKSFQTRHYSGNHLNIKMSYLYRDSHFKDTTLSQQSYLYYGNPHTRKDCLYIEQWSEQGTRFNIKMSSNQYRKSHCGDKTVVRSSYLHSGILVRWHLYTD